MIINMAMSGEGVDSLVSDATTGWLWEQLEDSLLVATGPLADRRVSAVAVNWATNLMTDVNSAGNGIIGNHLRPLFEGVRDAGAVTTFAMDHYLTDGATFPLSTVYAASPPTRYQSTNTGPFDFNETGGSPQNTGTARAQWLSYAAAYPSIIAAVGPYTDDIDMSTGGPGAGGPHQSTTAYEGNPRTLVRIVEAALRALGVSTRTNASLGTATINGGRTAITVPATLPNGGTLQTAWSIKSVSVPGGETTVQGFEVQDGGAGAWTRSGFTAEISGPSVVLTKASGSWAAGTKVRYNALGPLAYGTATDAGKLIHGQLYESGAVEGGLGWPVAGLWSQTL